LIPLGAAAFYSLERNPLAVLAAAFAGVAAAFGANFLVKPIDGILTEMTNDAIHVVDPAKSIDLMANYYFGVASSIVLIVVCTLISGWIVEPRLGKLGGQAPNEEGPDLSTNASTGLWYALFALIAFAVVVLLLTVPAGAPLRNPETGAIIGRSPFMDSLVFLITLAFFATGLAYGIGARTLTNTESTIDAITKTLADSGPLLFLFFVISQFVAYFNYSNIGTVLAVWLAERLQDANLNDATLLLAFLAIGFLISIPVPNILPKWAILAPVFVPLFLKLGIAPDVVLAAYRVSDSLPNVKVAMMLPYAVATFIAWTLLFFAWYSLGVPFGP
jgi:aminobenzoyl-glutamate transport protein